MAPTSSVLPAADADTPRSVAPGSVLLPGCSRFFATPARRLLAAAPAAAPVLCDPTPSPTRWNQRSARARIDRARLWLCCAVGARSDATESPAPDSQLLAPPVSEPLPARDSHRCR